MNPPRIVADAMMACFQSLDADTPVSEALELLQAGAQQDFPVKSGGELIGVLSRDELLEAAQTEGDNAPVGDALQGALTLVEPTTTLRDAAKLLRAQQVHAAAVLQHGRLVGIITRERLTRVEASA